MILKLVQGDLFLQLLHNPGEFVPQLHRQRIQLERIVQRDGRDARGLVNRPLLDIARLPHCLGLHCT